jgi:hypothetical protein
MTSSDLFLRASLIYAGTEIAREQATSGRTPDEALGHIKQGAAGRRGYDYPAAFRIAAEHGWDIFSADPDAETAFRETVTRLLDLRRPLWVRVLPAGRQRVVQSLDDDTRQCLEIAGLMGTEPYVVAWWDRLAALGRMWEEETRVTVGRDAEQRAMAYEWERLAGTDRAPRWLAIEDNGAGYDIQSWRPRSADLADLHEHYIEVKGSSRNGIIHLSRGEWSFAVAHAPAWEMQVWLPEAPLPAVLTVADVNPHIPANQGEGRWAEVEIPTDRLLPDWAFEFDTPSPPPELGDNDVNLLAGAE